MSSLAELMQKLNTTQYSIESTHWVDVTHIIQPDKFYVRPTAYRSYMDSLQAHDGPLDISKIKLSTIAIFQSKNKNCCVRGQIRNIREENKKQICELFALDYGFMEAVPSNKLYSPKHANMPALVLLCQLADCYPKGTTYDQKAIDAMVFYVGDERAKMIVKVITANKFIVQLINTCPEDISTMLALTGFTTLGHANNVASRMPTLEQPKLYFTYKRLKINDTIQVRVQSGDSLQSFFVCDVKEYAEHSASYDNFCMCLKHNKTLRDEELTIGMAVAIHNGLKYERAIVTRLGSHNRRPIGRLVDWGKSIEISANSLPKLLDKEYYFQKPALAIYCSTDDKQTWDNGLQRFLYPGYVFTITVKEVGSGFERPYIVNISKVEK